MASKWLQNRKWWCCLAVAGVWLGGVSFAYAQNGVTCCVNGTCVLADSDATCKQMGGVVLPAGTSCADNPCAKLDVVCCMGQDCLMLPSEECVNNGGTPLPPGITCADKPCEKRSCCLNNQCFNNILPADCIREGGTVLPAGQVCVNEQCPTPECGPNAAGTGCRQTTCPNPNQKCRPRCVNFDLKTKAFKVLDCECVGPEDCHLEPPAAGTNGFPQCVGTCPPGYKCNTRIVTLADGTYNICCDCQPDPPACKPNANKTACEGTCPSGTPGQCVPTKYHIGPNNQITVEECDCTNIETCHPVLTAAAGLQCVGPCPAGSGNCVPITTQDPDGSGLTFQCRCQPCDAATCNDQNPCTKDSCDPLTGQCKHEPINCDDGNKCTEDFCTVGPLGGPMCVHVLKVCDDGNACTDDRCDPQTGQCIFVPKVCPDDGDPCTIDTCDPATGECVHIPNPECQACCITLPTGGSTCVNTLPGVCKDQYHGTPQGPGTNCANVDCSQKPDQPKFSQLPTPDREDIASNINFSAINLVNKIVTDDFRSDGRPITSLRWWGSYIDPAFDPKQATGVLPKPMDGWLISFYVPLGPKPLLPQPALGVYFAPVSAVRITPTTLVACDQHTVYEYVVDLSKCCLVDSNQDKRVPTTDPWRCPARPNAFHERYCYRYSLGIQAVTGWLSSPFFNCCPLATPTTTFAQKDFWGWHTTEKEANVREALVSRLTIATQSANECQSLGCPSDLEFRYGPWKNAEPVCSFDHRINMAFELLTPSSFPVPPACPRLVLTSATSIRKHGAAGEFGIDLPLGAVADAAVEPRRGGPTRIDLTFSEEIMAGDGSVDIGDEVTVNVGTITSLSISGNVLTVELKDVPNKSCLLLTVENGPDGITTLGNDLLLGDNDVRARVLLGDVSGNGTVDAADIGMVKLRSLKPVNATTFKFDVSADGAIDAADIGMTKLASLTSVTCP